MTNKTDKLNRRIRPAEKTPLSNSQEARTLFNTPAGTALSGKKTFLSYDAVAKRAKYEIKDGTCWIESISHAKLAKNFPSKIFHYLSSEFTKINHRGCETPKTELSISVRQLQKDFGYKNYDTMKRRLKEGDKILSTFWLNHKKLVFCGKKKVNLNTQTRILESMSEIKQGVYSVKITETFAKYLVLGYLTKLPKNYFKLLDAIASEIYFKLHSHVRINKNNNKNRNVNDKHILSVEDILKNVQSIPCYDEVIKSNDRHAGRRIIKPFEDGLDKLEEKKLIKWEYCNQKGVEMTDTQLNTTKGQVLKWGVVKDLYIKYSLTNHEDSPDILPLQECNP